MKQEKPNLISDWLEKNRNIEIDKQVEKELEYKMKRTKDLLDQMMDYESGELSDKETLKMFSVIVKDGLTYSLQGHYGRTAIALIEDGWLDNKGNITKQLE